MNPQEKINPLPPIETDILPPDPPINLQNVFYTCLTITAVGQIVLGLLITIFTTFELFNSGLFFREVSKSTDYIEWSLFAVLVGGIVAMFIGFFMFFLHYSCMFCFAQPLNESYNKYYF